MSNNIFSFNQYLNEASLKGNLGIPGEEGGERSWLRDTTTRSDAAAREFASRNQQDIQNFGRLLARSIELQSGHEEELSQLATEAISALFGSLLDDVDLDLKVVTDRDEIKQTMEKTKTEKEDDEEEEEGEMPELEEIEDEEILNQISKRKILRTIQQGKGLNSKALLNLSLFKEGLVRILGPREAPEYLTVLNKISNVAQFFDWMIPIEQQKGAWQTREGFSGSCDIQFGEEPGEEQEKSAEDVLSELESGLDVIDSENAEDLVSGLNVKIVCRGIDLSVLIHESIKGVYKMITQAALEALYGSTAEKVLMNTDTLFDELEEIKFGRQMQSDFFKFLREHPLITERLDQMAAQDFPDWQIASFQEKIDYLFFNEIAQLGTAEAKEMLELVNAILMGSREAERRCDPIIRKVLQDYDQREDYEAWSRGERGDYSGAEEEEPEFNLPASREVEMTDDEISDAILDAYAKGDMAEVQRLERMLK